ncbi:hypothetical protein JFK97_00210 [Chromobacterium phragmitis]|nr:hypothetical protein [Chromobacterium amazonense]MBM2882814.1 hypothetical protein [Chromobacterium amazonense]
MALLQYAHFLQPLGDIAAHRTPHRSTQLQLPTAIDGELNCALLDEG